MIFLFYPTLKCIQHSNPRRIYMYPFLDDSVNNVQLKNDDALWDRKIPLDRFDFFILFFL